MKYLESKIDVDDEYAFAPCRAPSDIFIQNASPYLS